MRELSFQLHLQHDHHTRNGRFWTRRSLTTALAAIALTLASGVAVTAATVTGVVTNGTSGKPAVGVDVILIQLQGNMQAVANTKSDAQGNYTLDNAAIGQQPMLIRAAYRGVMFHQPLPPGRNTADVTVYEPTSDSKTLQAASRLIVFQTSGGNLIVGEEYGLRNQSQPPVAYFKQQGNFDFEIPESAELSQVSSWGPAGMPVVQGTINRGNRKYAIAYAFQPGESGVRLSYQLPYASNQATLRFNSDHAIQRVMLVAPPSMQISSPGFSPAGVEQGFNLYTRDNVPSGVPFEVALSGTAPMSSGGQVGDPSQGQDQVNGRSAGPAIQTMPDRLSSLRWILIVGFAALFSLGLLLVWRKPLLTFADGTTGTAAIPQGTGAKTKPSPASANHAASEIDRKVEQGLDGLKDKLFRLELRRQAGTISAEEYEIERARAEKTLRELVQG